MAVFACIGSRARLSLQVQQECTDSQGLRQALEEAQAEVQECTCRLSEKLGLGSGQTCSSTAFFHLCAGILYRDVWSWQSNKLAGFF